jgi:hypothetical protein
MFKKFAVAVSLLVLGSAMALAADLSGKWTASVETPRGTQTLTFDFHVDGAKLTGTVSSPRGEMEIQDGKIDGDTVTFNQTMSFNGNEFKIAYKGKIDADTIKFTRQAGDRPAQDFVATRVK